MRTPGRCTNLEGCWISASHRNVWLSIGEEFVCPNCGGLLSPPLPRSRSFRAAGRVAAIGAVATAGFAAMAFGTVKLSEVSWPGQFVAVAVVNVPAKILGFKPIVSPVGQAQLADQVPHSKPLTLAGEEKASLEVISARPSSSSGLQGISTFNARQEATHGKVASGVTSQVAPRAAVPAAPRGPVIIFKGEGERLASSGSARTDERNADLTIGQMNTALVTYVSSATLSPGKQMNRPVILPISLGEPRGPETDAEPPISSWHHHSVHVRPSGFLPAPAAATAPANADAIAQICRIPSLMH